MLTLFLSLLFNAPAIAADEPPLALSCVTEFPTTSFIIYTEGKEVIANVIHHNGVGYAPAISGIFTPNDLPILAERAALVKQMKDDMTFRWPKENCKKLGEMVIQCFSTNDVEEGVGGAKIAPFGLYSTAVVEEGIAGRLESTLVTLSFDVNGKSGASIEMKYPKGSCVPARILK